MQFGLPATHHFLTHRMIEAYRIEVTLAIYWQKSKTRLSIIILRCWLEVEILQTHISFYVYIIQISIYMLMQGSFNIHISVFSAGLYWSRYREGVFSSKSLGSFFCYVNPNIALFESPAFGQFNSIYMYIYGCMCHNNNMYPTLIALALTCENLFIVKMLVHQTNLLSHFIIWFIRIQLLFECAHLA